MSAAHVELTRLRPEEREMFITMNQSSFQIAVDQEFGPDAGTAIPREDIIESLDAPDAQSFLIRYRGEPVGGVTVQVHGDSEKASLDLLFVSPGFFGRGIGFAAWKAIESMYPTVGVWETHTPYFEVRNIHFYVNKCGFSIVEFYCPQNPMAPSSEEFPGSELFFRFEKRMRRIQSHGWPNSGNRRKAAICIFSDISKRILFITARQTFK